MEKNFGGLHALKDVSFSVDEGEIGGLVSMNIVGKIALFNVIWGIFPPTSGIIQSDGCDITG